MNKLQRIIRDWRLIKGVYRNEPALLLKGTDIYDAPILPLSALWLRSKGTLFVIGRAIREKRNFYILIPRGDSLAQIRDGKLIPIEPRKEQYYCPNKDSLIIGLPEIAENIEDINDPKRAEQEMGIFSKYAPTSKEIMEQVGQWYGRFLSK